MQTCRKPQVHFFSYYTCTNNYIQLHRLHMTPPHPYVAPHDGERGSRLASRAPGTVFFYFLSYYKGTNNYLYIAKTSDHIPVGRNIAKGDMREAT